MNKQIGSVEQMVKVLNNGAKISNLSRREMGKDAIQTSVNLHKLKIHAATMEFVDIPQILSMQCVTYVPHPKSKIGVQAQILDFM